MGKRVRVYWEDDQVWYSGVVKDYNRLTELHMVQFDDGDQREEPLNFPDEVTWELERAETPGAGRSARGGGGGGGGDGGGSIGGAISTYDVCPDCRLCVRWPLKR